ncbi:Phosphatidylinositol-3-phosphatase SAC1 [Microbotryomycetes sp. JL221]|nr:Phosphatidylinositol-3-phosphatase SAC1 [Microbotryomycetes sp. JL221]
MKALRVTSARLPVTVAEPPFEAQKAQYAAAHAMMTSHQIRTTKSITQDARTADDAVSEAITIRRLRDVDVSLRMRTTDAITLTESATRSTNTNTRDIGDAPATELMVIAAKGMKNAAIAGVQTRMHETTDAGPQLTEEEREMRTVFVSQLSARVGHHELGVFFEQQVGKVRDARVIMDRISHRSKGVGYVEFVELDSMQKALSLSGTKLLGIPIIVQYTEAEKNRQARDGPTTTTPSGPPTGLYVGSLNFALTDNDIRQVFQPFGPVEAVDLHKDPVTGKSKGFAFVQFKESKDAMQALEKMNNFVLAGREIKVGLVAEKGTNYSRQESQLEEGSGTSLNNISRLELMQKLARTDKPASDLPAGPMIRPNIPQAVTRNILIKNAFDPEEENERDWDIDLRDDVKSEAESKYGLVIDIFVVKESQGEIYIRFGSVDAAIKAVAGLNGRWFGGRQILASHATDSLFDAKK